jgi:hypothetical protein
MTNPEMLNTELRAKVAELKDMLLSKHPRMPHLLGEIWVNLKANPEQVTLLGEHDPEGVAAIVSGLENQTQTYLVTQTVKSTKSTAKIASLKSKGADAF